MEKDVDKERTRSAGDNNNEELTSMEVEDSEASTASLNQHRKLWRSKSTVKSQELGVDSANNVTNEELKELKQWFQVKMVTKHLTLPENGVAIVYYFTL